VQSRVPEFLMASEATKIQAAIGASTAMTFSVADLGCVSINAALITAESLLLANETINNVLIAHGSKPPTLRRFRRPVTLNGEGGFACLVSATGEGPRVLDLKLETNGEYWDLFHVEYRDKAVSEWVETCKNPKAYSFQLAIESRNRFRTINEEVLSRSSLTIDNVDHFIMQNLSLGAFNFYEEFFKIRFAKACHENLKAYGHLGSMDILFNLETGITTGEFSAGDKVLIMNNSPVAAWSSALVEIA
jgi:3-oxoacyl-[acyl-carrier-protein] synthase-3